MRGGVQAHEGNGESCVGGGWSHEGEGSHMGGEGGHSRVRGPA